MDPFDGLEFDDAPETPAAPPQVPTQPRRSLLLWLVAVGLGILVLPLSQISQTVRADNARLSSELENAQTAVGQTPTVGQEAAQMKSTLSALQAQSNLLVPFTKALTGKQVDWSDKAQTISDYDHAHVALTGLEQHENRLVITGRADSDTAVMAYAKSLEDSGKFSRVVVQSITGVSTPFTTPTVAGASQSTAEAIYVGEPQARTFDVPQQQQVLVFLAKAGRFYQVMTTNLAPGVDTSMSVTLDDGTNYANDDAKPGVLSSEVDFQAPGANLNATIRIDNLGRFGKDSTYQVVVKEVVPTPTPKAKAGGSGGGGSSASAASAPKATTAPTDTPDPTNTPKPTKTPVPTVPPTKVPPTAVPATNTPTATSTQDLRDAYEPDDVTPTAIGVGETQQRNFYPSGDADAASFFAKKNRLYLVQTANLAAGVDTAIVVTQGSSSWDNDDIAPSGTGNYASMVCFQAPATGSAVITINNNTGQSGPDKTYDLSVAEVPTISTGQNSLTFDPITEGDPAPAAKSLSLMSTVNTAWTAESDSDWLQLDAASGTTPSTINVSIDPTLLTAGDYTGAITVTWATACSKQVPVSIHVDASTGGASPITRFARALPWSHQGPTLSGSGAGAPDPVAAVEFAILVEVQTEQP